jgi:hypothetical protein
MQIWDEYDTNNLTTEFSTLSHFMDKNKEYINSEMNDELSGIAAV